jgi:hypothetical protein
VDKLVIYYYTCRPIYIIVIYIKINILITRGFRVILFYLKKNYKILVNLLKIAFIAIKLILFISKLLSPIKKNYYLTKLKIACLVYTYYRLRVIFYLFKYFIIILINYLAIYKVYN